jgi:hypothetical protein
VARRFCSHAKSEPASVSETRRKLKETELVGKSEQIFAEPGLGNAAVGDPVNPDAFPPDLLTARCGSEERSYVEAAVCETHHHLCRTLRKCPPRSGADRGNDAAAPLSIFR